MRLGLHLLQQQLTLHVQEYSVWKVRRLSASHLHMWVCVTTIRVYCLLLIGYAKQCEKRNTRQLLYKSFRRMYIKPYAMHKHIISCRSFHVSSHSHHKGRQQRPNSAVDCRSPQERLFVHDQELATPGFDSRNVVFIRLNIKTGIEVALNIHLDARRLKLAGEKKTLLNSAAVNSGNLRHLLQRNTVFSSRNRVVKKVNPSELDYVKMNIPGVPDLIGRREHYWLDL